MEPRSLNSADAPILRTFPRRGFLLHPSHLLFLALAFASLVAEDPPKDDLIMEAAPPVDRAWVVLGRPTASAMSLVACAPVDSELWVEHGARSNALEKRTPTARAKQGEAVPFTLDGLPPDSPWYYRLCWRSGVETRSGATLAFHTRRSPGKAFRFLIQADPHLDGNSSLPLYARVLRRMAEEEADLWFDLGDLSMIEKVRPQAAESVELRYQIFRPLLERVACRAPLFLVLGNHDGEVGWPERRNAAELPQWGFASRSRWFPNPLGDFLHSGERPGREYQNYYAVEWGDALFVVLDAYRYTPRKPPGRGGGDNWLYTLGEAQYRWLRSILEGSRAPYKFVFAHQLVGGNQEGSRGGAAFAPYYEWGGSNRDGTWGFDERRPGWGKPIHALLVETGVRALFHGHDHLYAREELDGVIYQACPQPSARNTQAPVYAADYGYTRGTILGNSGYLKIEVAQTGATVTYWRATQAEGRRSAAQGASQPEWNEADRYVLPPVRR